MASQAGAIRAGRVAVEMGLNDAGLQKGLDAAKQRLSAFAGALQSLGAALALGFVTNKITGWVRTFAEAGSEIFLMARAAQIGVAEMSELKTAVQILGGDLDGTVASMRKMSVFLNEFKTGGRAAQEAMAQLGISLEDLEGLSQSDKLQLIGEHLARIGDIDTRLALGRKIFGRDGGATVGLAGQLRGVRAKASDSASPFLQEDIARAFELKKAMDALDRAKKNVFKSIGGTLAPAFIVATNAIKGVVDQVRTWIDANRELIQKFALIGAAVTAVGGTILAVGVAARTFMFAFTGFTAVVSAMWTLAKVTSITYWTIFALSNVTRVWTVFVKIGTIAMAAWRAMIWATGIAMAALRVVTGLVQGSTVALTAIFAACSAAISLFTVATTAVAAPLTLIPGLIGALVVGLAALAVVLFSTSEAGQNFFAAIGRGFSRIGEVFGQVFTGIKAAIETGDLKMAFHIALAGCKVLLSEFNDWFGIQFGVTFTDAFSALRIGFAETIAFIKTVWRLAAAEMEIKLTGLLNVLRVANFLLPGGGLIQTAIDELQSQPPRPLAAVGDELAQQLATIERDRRAARARIEAGRPGPNTTADAQQELDDLTRDAFYHAYSAQAARELEEAADATSELGPQGSSARSTFNRDVLFGFGGAANPVVQRLERVIQLLMPLRRIDDNIENLAPAEVS